MRKKCKKDGLTLLCYLPSPNKTRIACAVLTLDAISCWRAWSWRTIVKLSLSIASGAAHEKEQLGVRDEQRQLGNQHALFLQLEDKPWMMAIERHEVPPGRLGTYGLSTSLWQTSRWWHTAVHRHNHPSKVPSFSFRRRTEGVAKTSLRVVMKLKRSRASSRASRSRRIWCRHTIHNNVLTSMPITQPYETSCLKGLRYRTHNELWEGGQNQ